MNENVLVVCLDEFESDYLLLKSELKKLLQRDLCKILTWPLVANSFKLRQVKSLKEC